MLQLTCQARHPLTPSLTPGDTFTLARCGRALTLTFVATPLMLHNLSAAVRDGAVMGDGDMDGEELLTHLRALMAPAMDRAG